MTENNLDTTPISRYTGVRTTEEKMKKVQSMLRREVKVLTHSVRLDHDIFENLGRTEFLKKNIVLY